MGFIKDLFVKETVEDTMPARCSVTKEDFDILLGTPKGRLTMIGSKRSECASSSMSGSRSGSSKGMKVMKTIDLSNGLDTGRTYHCPICGNKSIVRCGRCHHITCYDRSGHFICAYCGNSGQVSGTMKRIEVYDSSGMKSGLKQDGMKYYPGDK